MGIIDQIRTAETADQIKLHLRSLGNYRGATQKTIRRAKRCAKRRLAELEAV